MSVLNVVTPEGKRAGAQHYSKRQRLGSEDVSKPSTHLERLPIEIMEIVAKHLAAREDLKSFSEISSLTKCSVLNVVNIQNESLAVSELQVLSNLNPSKPDQVSSVVDFYQDFITDMRDPLFWLGPQGLQIDDHKLQQLQQTLTALKTSQVAQRSRALKLACYQEILNGKASIASIDDKYASLKSTLVCEALKEIISFSVNPAFTNSFAFKWAANYGHLLVIQTLIADGPGISDSDRATALKWAAGNGHTPVVEFLLTNSKISEEERGCAVCLAAQNGYLAVVQVLLADEARIPAIDRGWAIRCAAENGHLEVVRFLLTTRAQIYKKFLEEACILASTNGHSSVMQSLLENRSEISKQSKLIAFGYAAENGHLAVLHTLIENGVEISSKDRGKIVRIAARYGRLEVVRYLLENKASISSEDKEEAVANALQSGHAFVADFLRKN